MRKPQSANLTRKNKRKQQQNTKSTNQKKTEPSKYSKTVCLSSGYSDFELPTHIPTMNE